MKCLTCKRLLWVSRPQPWRASGLSRPAGGCRHCRVQSVDCMGAAQQSAWPLLSTSSFHANHQQRAPARLPPPRPAQGSFIVSLPTGIRVSCPCTLAIGLARRDWRKRRVVKSRLATCIRRQPDQPAFDLASDCIAFITNKASIICAATTSIFFISTMPVRISRPRVLYIVECVISDF